MPIRGFTELNNKFKQAMDSIETSRTQRFMSEVLTAIKVEAALLTPRDTSFLANSAYSKVWRTASGWSGAVGYGAEYAEWVHNMPGKLKGQPRARGTGKGTYWSPDAEPRFLEKAVRTVLTNDLQAILDNQYRI